MNEYLLYSSKEVADEILGSSYNLADAGASSDLYVDRIPYLQELLDSNGHIDFHPLVMKDLSIDFKQLAEPYYDVFTREYRQSDYGSVKERESNCKRGLVTRLLGYVDNESLLSNTVPKVVSDYIKDWEIKGYSSPKLSKLLVKVFGEQSDVVSWFTNKCPKQLESGINDKYRVHLSILPHHIAGMSYYAPFNSGGAKWIDGWNFTSCMDTVRNSDGATIYKLPPNLKDSHLAIAYLTTDENDDLYAPKYLSRMLVRVAKVNDSDYVLLGLRTYSTSNETSHILSEGLKNEFENFVHVSQLKAYAGRMKTFTNGCDVTWECLTKGACNECGGEGWEDCNDCGGSGNSSDYETHHPYIDNNDYVRVHGDTLAIALPKSWLKDQGLLEEELVTTSKLNTAYLAC